MNRLIFLIVSFLMCHSVFAIECKNLIPQEIEDTSFIKEGDIGIFPEENDIFGSKKVVVGVDFVCPEIDLINGSAVNYLFLDNNITEIVITRIGFKDTNLFQFSEKNFGKLLNNAKPSLQSNQDFYAEWPDMELIISYASRISPFDNNFQEILFLRLKKQEERYLRFLTDIENINNEEFNENF